MSYVDFGQALREAYDMTDKRAKSKENKKLNESKQLKESYGYLETLNKIFDMGVSAEEMLQNILQWLDTDTVERFAEDMARDYDLDYAYAEEE